MVEKSHHQERPMFTLSCSRGSVDVQVGTGFELFTQYGWALKDQAGKVHRYPDGRETPLMLVVPPKDINPDDYSQRKIVLPDGEVLFEITADTIADAVLKQKEAAVSYL